MPGRAAADEYHQARHMLAQELRAIASKGPGSGFEKVADDIENGVGTYVQSWVALELITRALNSEETINGQG